MIGLTEQQHRLRDFIIEFIAANGIAPSVREMSEHFDFIGVGNIHRLLGALVERGAIRRIPNRARAIEIIEPDALHNVTTDELVAELTRRGFWKVAA